jgi:predicted lipoprotein with Yx(FWY)xxD motif
MLCALALLAASAAGILAAGGSGVHAQASPTVQVRNVGSFGNILTSADGKTLYMFDRDTPGTSNCTGTCATTWPPLMLASGNPTAPSGFTGTLGVINRSDSGRQVTYNNQPLYNFSGDSAAGDTKGDGVGGIWHVVKLTAAASAPAAGSAAATPAASTTSAGASGAAPARSVPTTGSGGLINNQSWLAVALLTLAAAVSGLGGFVLLRRERAG